MRLLNTSTYKLESFLGASKPPYAILSHTWEPEGEILFDHLQSPTTQLSSLPGFPKVQKTCAQALKDGFTYVWIDTCCIDKSSSAELSEAINSMFRWYKQSKVCYAFLADVESKSAKPDLSKSRWFTRGWTLQELIAPGEVRFFNANWHFLGTRASLASAVTSASRIPNRVLDRSNHTVEEILQSCSVAQRMTWASERFTTREEDIAYCLMGLFDINMPLLYGEGQRAFTRLQELILYGSRDQTILAFRHPEPPYREESCIDGFSPLLAPDPSFFCDDVRRDQYRSAQSEVMKLDGGNLTLKVLMLPLTDQNKYSMPDSKFRPTHIAFLDGKCGGDYMSRPGILVRQFNDNNGVTTHYKRCASQAVLVKTTLEKRWDIRVMGCDNITESVWFECNSPLLLWRDRNRELITLEGDTSDAVSNQRGGTSRLLILEYASLLQSCSFVCAHPAPNTKDLVGIYLWRAVGIALFRYQDLEFIIAWGYDLAPWCSAHSFQETATLFDLCSKIPGLQPGSTAEELVECLAQAKLHDDFLTKVFKKAPDLCSKPFVINRVEYASTNVHYIRSVKARWMPYDEIVGRTYRRLQLHTDLRLYHPPRPKGKLSSWLRKS